MPKHQHHPTPQERDGRVKLDLPPDEAIRLVMATGPHPEDEAMGGTGRQESPGGDPQGA
ncbi:MAG: hypothetical protein ABSH04_00150 [Acidimicrobiales bacterium]|jgi:hypothetical protein